MLLVGVGGQADGGRYFVPVLWVVGVFVIGLLAEHRKQAQLLLHQGELPGKGDVLLDG